MWRVIEEMEYFCVVTVRTGSTHPQQGEAVPIQGSYSHHRAAPLTAVIFHNRVRNNNPVYLV